MDLHIAGREDKSDELPTLGSHVDSRLIPDLFPRSKVLNMSGLGDVDDKSLMILLTKLQYLEILAVLDIDNLSFASDD